MTQNTQVSTVNANLPDFLREKMETGIVRGNENVKPEDQNTPQLKLLQMLSAELKKSSGDKYLPDAKAGQLLHSVTRKLYDEVDVINVHYEKGYTIWLKANPKATSGMPAYRCETEDQAAQFIDDYCRENGEDKRVLLEPQETAIHSLLMIDPETGALSPLMSYYSKTKLKVSNDWNTQLAQTGVDRFATVWTIAGVTETNKNGDEYFNFAIRAKGYVTPEQYDTAEKAYASIVGA